jgi:hypothetical protein
VSESGFPLSRYNHAEYPEAVTRAERFVDDTTHLRMMRFRAPIAKTELHGITSETIKQIHLADATVENWAHVEDDGSVWRGRVDLAIRFPDESLAIRMRDTGRWEVWRTW